jgi:hypothetical protein
MVLQVKPGIVSIVFGWTDEIDQNGAAAADICHDIPFLSSKPVFCEKELEGFIISVRR